MLRCTLPKRNWHMSTSFSLLVLFVVPYLRGIDTFRWLYSGNLRGNCSCTLPKRNWHPHHDILLQFLFLTILRCTLPKRNWHTLSSVTSWYIFSFVVPYLRGIDTITIYICQCSVVDWVVVPYLRGIDTFFIKDRWIFFLQRLYLT